MKTFPRLSLVLPFLVFFLRLAAADERVFQCAMHPWIKSDKPGKCTICGMKLVAAGAAAFCA